MTVCQCGTPACEPHLSLKTLMAAADTCRRCHRLRVPIAGLLITHSRLLLLLPFLPASDEHTLPLLVIVSHFRGAVAYR